MRAIVRQSKWRFIPVAALALALVLASGQADLVPASTARAQTPEPQGDSGALRPQSPQMEAIAAAVEQAMAQYGVPGAMVGVYADGRQEVAAVGVSDIRSNEPVTSDTRFQIGSINKPYTATAIMRLVEQGAVDLDAPVRSYVPELQLKDATVAEQVTVRHLLTHSGGWWGDAFNDTGAGPDAIARYVTEVLPRLPQIAPFGRYFSYNNAGFVLLGRLIENVTGKDYRTALQELVLDPLGLSTATFEPDTVLAAPHARGHGPGVANTEIVTPLFLPRSQEPPGGLWMTVEDQLRFARFQLGETPEGAEGILTPESLELMRTPQLPFSGQPGASIGLPWIVAETGDITLVDHEGGTFGQTAKLTLIPERSFAIAVLTNSQTGGAVAQVAVAAALEQYFGGGEPPQPAESPPPPPAQPPQPALEDYAGRYEVPNGVHTLTVEDGVLITRFEWLDWPGQVEASNTPEEKTLPPMSVIFVAPDHAVLGSVEEPLGVLSFLRHDDGSVGWLVDTSRLYPRAP